MAHDPQGKFVIITGSSTGIGQATALHLDHLGYNVIATVRKEADAAALQTEAENASAVSRLRPLLLDVTEEASLAQFGEILPQLIGDQGLYGLINNAGVAFIAPLEFTPVEQMRCLFDVNLFGVLSVTQLCLPYLRQVPGRILNVSSISSFVVAPFHGSYASTKAGLNAFTQALRLELQPFGIQVSTLIIGNINTPIWTKAKWSRGVWRTMPKVARTLYGKRLAQLISYFRQFGRSGLPPVDVAEVMGQVLSARHPKPTYYIGRDAQKYRVLDNILTDRQQDWLTLRTTGLD